MLSEGTPTRRAALPFLLQALAANACELELDARAAATAATLRASGLGRLFARVCEMAQSPVATEVEDASVVLAACMAAGACGDRGLEAFAKQWLASVTAFLLPRHSLAVRGRGSACAAYIVHAVHAVGKDTHVGRETSAALVGLLPSLVRVLEAPVGPAAPDADAAGVAQCLEAWRALLVFSPQTVRTHAHRLTSRCLAALDSRHALLAGRAQECLALLCHQVRDPSRANGPQPALAPPRCCSLLPAAARCCPLLLAAARCCSLLPAAARCCSLLLAAARCCLLLLAAACCCSLLPAAARCCLLLLAAACLPAC